jgi:hypothetical protein
LLAGLLGESCLTAAGCALRRPNPEVTPQVDSSPNRLNGKSLKELASTFGLTIAQVTPQVTTQVEKVLTATAHRARSREELQAATGKIDREHFRKAYIEPLVTAGWLERTIPDKPTSRLQEIPARRKRRRLAS